MCGCFCQSLHSLSGVWNSHQCTWNIGLLFDLGLQQFILESLEINRSLDKVLADCKPFYLEINLVGQLALKQNLEHSVLSYCMPFSPSAGCCDLKPKMGKIIGSEPSTLGWKHWGFGAKTPLLLQPNHPYQW